MGLTAGALGARTNMANEANYYGNGGGEGDMDWRERGLPRASHGVAPEYLGKVLYK